MPHTQSRLARLADRGVVAVRGPDAGKLLQGLVTNDLSLLETQPALHAALLTPQGKILFDFFVCRVSDGFLLDCDRARAADAAKRLVLYKLRAAVEIKDVSAEYSVFALWEPETSIPAEDCIAASFTDPRLAALGQRLVVEAGSADRLAAQIGAQLSDHTDYHAHRIALGVPEGGKDYASGDAFPHEALLDLLNGVSFTKGCYVGQEIVSRMEHRGTARKRIVPVWSKTPLPASGTEIKAGDVVIGTLGSVAGQRGLAMIRLDRAQEFADKGIALMAGGVTLQIEIAPWAKGRLVAAS